MKSLIVTADDFGYSRAVNEAVLEAYRKGVLRFASLMVYGSAVEEAAGLAKANPGLGVGLHLDLCRDRPELWGMRYFFNTRLAATLEGEIASQIERCLALGIKPTHIDGHLNIHVHPTIFPALARLARRYGIPRLRLPGGELPLSLSYRWQKPARQALLAGTFGLLGACLRRRAQGLTIPQQTFGLLRSGMLTEDYLLWLIERLPEGLTEIYCHPSSDPASAVSGAPTATHQTVSELAALTSASVRRALERRAIRLVAAADRWEA